MGTPGRSLLERPGVGGPGGNPCRVAPTGPTGFAAPRRGGGSVPATPGEYGRIRAAGPDTSVCRMRRDRSGRGPRDVAATARGRRRAPGGRVVGVQGGTVLSGSSGGSRELGRSADRATPGGEGNGSGEPGSQSRGRWGACSSRRPSAGKGLPTGAKLHPPRVKSTESSPAGSDTAVPPRPAANAWKRRGLGRIGGASEGPSREKLGRSRRRRTVARRPPARCDSTGYAGGAARRGRGGEKEKKKRRAGLTRTAVEGVEKKPPPVPCRPLPGTRC